MGETVPSDLEAARWCYENALDVLMVIATERFVVASPAWTLLTGWSEAETLGRNYLVFTHPEERPAITVHAERLSEEGLSTCEHRLLAKDGTWIWVRSRLKRGDDGRTLAVIQDLGDRRRRPAARVSATRVAELLGVNAGVYVWRFDSIAREYNFNLLMDGGDRNSPGMLAEEADFHAAIHPEDRPRVEAAWREALKTGEIGEIEYRYHFGEIGWRRMRTRWHGLLLQNSGEWEMLGISQDVTEISDARDAALEASEVKSRFLANMNHEIRTPMNGVLGVLQILKNDNLSARNRALVDEALGCGTALAQMLHDIVEFTGMEAEGLELAPEPVELSDALGAVVGTLRQDAEARGLKVESSAPPPGAWASLDPLRLRQILLNLVGNALKFTLEGGVTVKLTMVEAGESQRARIEVRDTGIGVSAAAQAHLFERFRQGDASSTRRFGGLGLGLAVTKALVERMGGRIGFFSAEGEGSTFWVEVAAPACAAPRPVVQDAYPCLEGLRVLVVEDNPTNRLVATRMLCELGAEVDTAENGAEGVARARSGAYDLIFMDIQMPVMDGVQAAREIRALPGLVGQTPIVATTANVLAHQIESYRVSGMNGCVAKPISPRALLTEIARLAS